MPELAWEYTFRSGSDANAPYAVAVGNAGEVYVAGDVGSGVDWRVLRLTPDGSAVWTFDVATDTTELPTAITLTPQGQVVAAGHTFGATMWDYLVISISPEGRENWRYTVETPGEQRAKGIAADSNGNLYVVGDSDGTWEVFSLGSTGKLRWKDTYRQGTASAVALDTSGNLLVAGTEGSDWRVMKLTADGKLVWEHREPGEHNSVATAIAVDATGSAIVTGSRHEGRLQLLVKKLDPAGKVLWVYVDKGEPAAFVGRGVAIDESGNVIVVGETAEDWILLSLDPQGNLRWRVTYDGGGGVENRDQAIAVTKHPAGGFVVTGCVHRLPPLFPSLGQVDWRVARYRPAADTRR